MKDAVLNSKLPDEIKKLMIENPIVQPQMNGPTLSDELLDGAARLMNQTGKGQPMYWKMMTKKIIVIQT
jgi:hypothetical protein